MYLCENCSKNIDSNTPSYLFTLKSRKKQYPPRACANKFKKDGRIKVTNDPGGKGYEIETEIRVCPNCYKQLMKK